MGAIARRLRALERRIGDKDFNSGAPPVDEDGLPCWGGSESLTVESYTKALGSQPDEELSGEELATRHRLAPYIEVFERLDEKSEEEGEPVT